MYETRQEQPRIEEGKTKEKRKADNISGTEPPSKKVRTADIRDMLHPKQQQ